MTLQAAAGGTARFDSEWYVGSALESGAGSSAFGIGTPGNTGTVELGNNLTTSGAVSVNFGRLHVDSDVTLGGDDSAVTVYSGATLSGVGTVAKPVVVFSGGIRSPDSSPG